MNTLTLHEGQPVLSAGQPLESALKAMILVHGRGASAQDILSLAQEIYADDFAYLAPQAANFTWYPNRFNVPTAQNEPWLGSALAVIGGLVARAKAAGIASEQIYLLGFSQGACLSLEYAARNPARYGGIFGLSGALIGGDGEARKPAEGSFAGTPVFLGCSTTDPHIPESRVRMSAATLKQIGAEVYMKLYPRMGHTINQDELDAIRSTLAAA